MRARITVHVTPRAGRDEVVGWRGDALSVRVSAPPDGGKANAAVEKLIAGKLGVPKTAANVVRGHTARTKHVEVDGVDQARVLDVFGEPDAPLF